jgi:hypothetical protein
MPAPLREHAQGSARAGAHWAWAQVPLAAGLRLPRLGSPRNNVRLTLSTDASEGRTPTVPIELSEPVGSFGGSSTVLWEHTPAGGVLSLSVTPTMALAAGDTLSFVLPLFAKSNASIETSLVVSGRSSAVFGSAIWTVRSIPGPEVLSAPPGT